MTTLNQSTDSRLSRVEIRLDQSDKTLESIAEAIKALTRLEIQNTRIEEKLNRRDEEQKQFREDVVTAIGDIRSQVDAINADMPDLRRINKAVWGAIQTIGFSLFVAVMGAAGFKILH